MFGWVIGFIELLQIVRTNNYSAIPNSHTLQFTTPRIKSSHLLCRHRLPGNGPQRRSFLSFRVQRLPSSLAGTLLLAAAPEKHS
jgi:hypothetical protein